MNSRYPPQFPPIWAVAFGDDRFGLWAELAVDGVVQRMRWIEAGEFLMGSPDDELGRDDDEGPQHRVRMTEGFWLADTACTQGFWLAVLGGENPSYFFDDPENPVEQVSWDDVQIFLQALRERLPKGSDPALPTEAQWEYACRAGTRTPFFLGETLSTAQANYDGNYPNEGGAKSDYRQRTVPVKALPANDWGLYEMHGNVSEWCADGFREYVEVGSDTLLVNPEGPSELYVGVRTFCTVRGGSWFYGARNARSAYRLHYQRDYRARTVGFRLALRS